MRTRARLNLVPVHPLVPRRYNTEPGEVKEEESLNLTSAIWFAWGVLLNSGQCWQCSILELSTNIRESSQCPEKTFFLLKVPTSVFTIIKTQF